MKKILLLATAFTFSFALMAQNETKRQVEKKFTKDQKVTTVPTTKTAAAAPTTVEAKPQIVQAQPVQTGPSPDDVIKVNTVEHNFGKIKQGVPVTYAFELKNISKTPIVVENTYASCGCTTPEKIVEPIAPGATAKLKVQFNAAAIGPINKDVHIKLAGIAQEKLVKITGEVVAAEPTKEEKPNN